MKRIILNLPRFARVAMLISQVCVPASLFAGSQLVAWGLNTYGQATIPADCTNIVAIAAGPSFSLVLRADGTIKSWGDNSSFQTNVPPGLSNVVAISAGGQHALALKGDGSVVAWGNSGKTNIPAGATNVAAMAGGDVHSVFLRADGAVFAAGQAVPSNLTNATAIAGGFQHSLAVTPGGFVVAWGQSENGATSVPAGLSNVVAVAAGSRSTALIDDSTVAEWGTITFPYSQKPAVVSNVTAIAAGGPQSLVLKGDGSVVEWGIEVFGGGAAPALTNAVAIAAGSGHRLALLGTGPPLCNQAAVNWTVQAGGVAQFSISAAGAPPLSYQWRFNGTNLLAATNSILRLTGVQATNEGNYAVVITNLFGAVTSSPPAVLTVLGPPVILSQPQSQTVPQGSNATFTVTAGGSSLTYRWQFNGTNLSGATTSTLTLTNVQPINAGNYTVLITNAFGSVTSSPPALLTVEGSPVILTPPQSQTVVQGSNAMFTVTATGSSLSYEWRFNGTNLSGATASTLTLTNVQPTNAGNYTVLITNVSGSVTSSPPAMLTVQPPGVVGSVSEASLRMALAGGGTVTFTVDGTITLSGTIVITNDTVLDASGHTITISGNNAVRVFQVNSGVQFTLQNLTVANGRTNQGAGLYNVGGAVTVLNCTFTNNQAVGAAGSGGISPGPGETSFGGAIYIVGTLAVLDSLFTRNSASGGTGGLPSGPEGPGGTGGGGNGGAIYNLGSLNVANTSFSVNAANGGTGGNSRGAYSPGGGGGANGGAIFNLNASAVVSNCLFAGNGASAGVAGTSVQGRAAPYRGAASGGAICNQTGNVTFASVIIASNSASGSPASGGGVYHGSGVLTLSNAMLINNGVIADRTTIGITSTGSAGTGGGLYNAAVATLTDSIISSNTVSGGLGVSGVGGGSPDGGDARGGGVYNSGTIGYVRCALVGNTIAGGVPGPFPSHYGSGYGGAVMNDGGQASMLNSTIAFNSTTSGAGGNSLGGGIWNGATLTNCTLFGNRANGGSGGNLGHLCCPSVMINTILAGGAPNNGGFVDSGHNLVSLSNPQLGPLGNYGGPTPTIPLLAGSPALDAADNASAPATDQRGRSRPYGGASDVGAFESSAPFTIIGHFFGLDASHSISVTFNGLTTNVVSGGSFRFGGLAAGPYSLTSSIPPFVVAPNPLLVVLGPDKFDADFTEYAWNTINMASPSNGAAHVIYAGTNGQSHRLLASSNLVTWFAIATNIIGPVNHYEVFDTGAVGQPMCFYRSVSP